MEHKDYKRVIDDRWSFRNANTKEYTHCYHSYPAMMIPQIARALITEYRPSGRLKLIFDPYVGSGTTLVEACIAGIKSIGTDLNPLARLLSRVKCTTYNEREIIDELSEIQSRLLFFQESMVRDCSFEHISNYSFWYSKDSLIKLSYLSQLIDEYSSSFNKDFFKVALSEVVREASYTRNGEFKRFRMKEEAISSFHPDVFGLFERKVQRNICGLQLFNKVTGLCNDTHVYDFNTTEAIPSDIICDGDVDMVVTSPPYGDSRTTVSYGQFSRWANEWFRFENAVTLDNLLMGGKKTKTKNFDTISISEQLNEIGQRDEKRYWEVVSFLNDYSTSIANIAKSVRKGGVVCYVVGDRRVKNVQIPLDFFTAEMFEKHGFKHNITIVREIPNKRMPSKSSPTNIAGNHVETMSNEFIVILNKVE